MVAYKSGDVAGLYNISHETLRTWSREFGEYLSSSAQPDRKEQRLYTQDDMAVIALIADMRAESMSLAEIHLALKSGQRGQPPVMTPQELKELLTKAREQKSPEELQTALISIQDALQRALIQLEALQDVRAENIRLATSIEYEKAQKIQLEQRVSELTKQVEELSRELGRDYAKGFTEGFREAQKGNQTKNLPE